MRSDVHFAALKAAAKLALGMAVFTGCSAAQSPDEVLGSGDDSAGDEAESSESAIAAKGGSTKPGAKPGSTLAGSKNKNCTKDAGPPKPSCEQVLASAFPDAGDNWPGGDVTNVAQEVKDCCIAEIKEKGFEAPHRWSCCMATNWGQDANDQQVSIACTPWGPPVPPKMNKKQRVDPKPDAWALHMGVA